MSALGEAIDEVRAALAEEAAEILADVGTLSHPGAATSDAYGEDVVGNPTTIENLPCEYEPLSAYERQGESVMLTGADHKLRLPYFWGGAALNVAPSAMLTVNARGLNPTRTFRVTGPLPSSSDGWLRVLATLIQ